VKKVEQKTPNALPKLLIESAHLLAVVEQNIFQIWFAIHFCSTFHNFVKKSGFGRYAFGSTFFKGGLYGIC